MFDVPAHLSQKNNIPATTSNATNHQNQPIALRFDRFRTKFPLYEFVMVKIFVRQAEMAGVCGLQPAGLFIRAAFGTNFSLGRHFGAAVRTNIRRHFIQG